MKIILLNYNNLMKNYKLHQMKKELINNNQVKKLDKNVINKWKFKN